MCGQIMEKFFCVARQQQKYGQILRRKRDTTSIHRLFVQVPKFLLCAETGPSLVCRREQILIRYWRCYIIIHQTIPTPHRHMHQLLHSVSVRRIFVTKRDDIYSFLKKQIFHPTNPKYQILICILNVYRERFKKRK